jgi:Fe-S-cluster containining protein
MPEMHPSQTDDLLEESSAFPFVCHDALPCFTQCCRDVNIYLTPYDVLRLRKAVGGGSSEFLAKYTRSFLAKVANIPVVQLVMDPDTLRCPFVSDEGCQVYENRPWACRMFPLDLSTTRDKYRLISGKERCKGLFEHSKGTVGDWLESQGVEKYAQMDREFQSVVPERFKPGAAMNEGLGRVLFMAYDLDRFAELLKDSRFRKFYDMDAEMLRIVHEDPEELLNLAFRYIRSEIDDLYQVL